MKEGCYQRKRYVQKGTEARKRMLHVRSTKKCKAGGGRVGVGRTWRLAGAGDSVFSPLILMLSLQ